MFLATVVPVCALLAAAIAAALWVQWTVLNPPIDFHGYVEDQDGKPLPGVSVIYSYGQVPGKARIFDQLISKKHGRAVSGPDGRFHIHDVRGFYLHVHALGLSGYAQRGLGIGQYAAHGRWKSAHPMPRPSDRIVFRMISSAAMDALVVSDDSAAVELPGNGTPVRWDLWGARPDPGGELGIVFPHRLSGTRSNLGSLEISGGGFVPRQPNSREVIRAPESGYESRVLFEFPTSANRPVRLEYFIRTPDGRHGLLSFEMFEQGRTGKRMCRIRTRLNPNPGHRLLELDYSRKPVPRTSYSSALP